MFDNQALLEELALQEKAKINSVQGHLDPKNNREALEGFVSPVDNVFTINLPIVDNIPAWSYYPQRRDRDLKQIAKSEYLMAGAIYSLEARMRALAWKIKGSPRVKKYFQDLLGNANFGDGWADFVGKIITDLLTQDNGAFIELIGPGRPDKPLKGRVQHIAHLDSSLCWRTHSQEFPVVYTNPYTNSYHALHTSRVIRLSSNTQPEELAKGVGFCSVSRALRAIQIMRDLTVYKHEKISGRFRRGIIYGNGLTPKQFKQGIDAADEEQDNLGFAMYRQMPVLLSQQPNLKLDILNLASVPDGFNWESEITTYVFSLALAFGVDAREFWPASASGATKADATVQHLKARGKGIGDLIQTIERAINWKILPEGVEFVFDYTDDDQDRLRAELQGIRIDNLGKLSKVGAISSQEVRAIAISEGIIDPTVLATVSLNSVVPLLSTEAEDTAPSEPVDQEKVNESVAETPTNAKEEKPTDEL